MLPNSVSDFDPEKYLTRKDEKKTPCEKAKRRNNAMRKNHALLKHTVK